MKLLLLLTLAAISHARPRTPSFHPLTSSDPTLNKTGYTTLFLETFPGGAGTLPSSTNWLFDLGTSYPGGPSQWGNNEHETYTNSPSNIHITDNNTLAINPRLNGGIWTSARIETQRTDFVAVAGGKLYVEARIKLGGAPTAKQQGIWPAFWALGAGFRGNYSNWPEVSEWDILETVNGGGMHSTLHCGTAPKGPCDEYNGIAALEQSFVRDMWHTVGLVIDRSMCQPGGNGTWLDETLNWYLDGRKILTVSGRDIADEGVWSAVAHDGHFLLLNVAVGGNWPGAPNSQTIDGPSVGMEVDYVGVWKSIDLR